LTHQSIAQREEKKKSQMDPSFSLVVSIVVIAVTIFYAGRKLLSVEAVYIHEGRKRHSWKSIKYLERSAYCSVCSIMILSNGFFCECCGVVGCTGCIKKAERQFRCKEKRLKDGKNFKHLFVKGNLAHSDCGVCGQDIDSNLSEAGYGYRCGWCQTQVHEQCLEKIPEVCDFGTYRDMIVPPFSVIAARTRNAPKLHLTGIQHPGWPNWKPLIVIANTKSGSNSASQIVSHFRSVLNPLQVMELGANGPTDALQWIIKASPVQCRILAAGGDGTIGWILNTIVSLNIEPFPEVAICPLGTGNDLARVLGWGAEAPVDLNPLQILKKIQEAEVVKIDRWQMHIDMPVSRFHLKGHKRNLFVYNYFSIGVDALVSWQQNKKKSYNFSFCFFFCPGNTKFP
jgi:diacylglycerol kinase (ATP)